MLVEVLFMSLEDLELLMLERKQEPGEIVPRLEVINIDYLEILIQ